MQRERDNAKLLFCGPEGDVMGLYDFFDKYGFDLKETAFWGFWQYEWNGTNSLTEYP
jgi:hypothetical protein